MLLKCSFLNQPADDGDKRVVVVEHLQNNRLIEEIDHALRGDDGEDGQNQTHDGNTFQKPYQCAEETVQNVEHGQFFDDGGEHVFKKQQHKLDYNKQRDEGKDDYGEAGGGFPYDHAEGGACRKRAAAKLRYNEIP